MAIVNKITYLYEFFFKNPDKNPEKKCPICEENSPDSNMVNACNSCNTLICLSCHDLSNSRIVEGKIVQSDYCKCPMCSKFIKDYDNIEFDPNLLYAVCIGCKCIKSVCQKDCAKNTEDLPPFKCPDCIELESQSQSHSNPYRKCPHCNVLTERNGGCNHMTCGMCNKHWCWICNQGFNNKHDTEQHCIDVHGGLFVDCDIDSDCDNDDGDDSDNDDGDDSDDSEEL